MTVLVTGASGYLGGHVLSALTATGAPVAALSRLPWDVGEPQGVAFVSADLCVPGAARRLVAELRPDTIIHLAAHIPARGEADSDATSRRDTLEATRDLLSVLDPATVGRLVFASSISVYPPRPADGVAHREDDPLAPETAYGEHKRQAEALIADWARASAATAVILRLAGLHGPPRRSGVVGRFIESARAGTALAVAAPEAVFSLLFVDDAAAAAVVAATRPLSPGVHVFNIAGGDVLSLAALAERIVALAGTHSPIRHGDAPPRRSVLDITRARAGLGFTPAPIDHHLRRALAGCDSS